MVGMLCRASAKVVWAVWVDRKPKAIHSLSPRLPCLRSQRFAGDLCPLSTTKDHKAPHPDSLKWLNMIDVSTWYQHVLCSRMLLYALFGHRSNVQLWIEWHCLQALLYNAGRRLMVMLLQWKQVENLWPTPSSIGMHRASLCPACLWQQPHTI